MGMDVKAKSFESFESLVRDPGRVSQIFPGFVASKAEKPAAAASAEGDSFAMAGNAGLKSIEKGRSNVAGSADVPPPRGLAGLFRRG